MGWVHVPEERVEFPPFPDCVPPFRHDFITVAPSRDLLQDSLVSTGIAQVVDDAELLIEKERFSAFELTNVNMVSVVQVDENARRERLSRPNDIVRTLPVSVPSDVDAVSEVRFGHEFQMMEQARLDDLVGVDGDGIIESEFNCLRVSSLPVGVFFVPIPGEDGRHVLFADLNGLLPLSGFASPVSSANTYENGNVS